MLGRMISCQAKMAQTTAFATRLFAVQLKFSKTHEWIKYDTDTKVG